MVTSAYPTYTIKEIQARKAELREQYAEYRINNIEYYRDTDKITVYIEVTPEQIDAFLNRPHYYSEASSWDEDNNVVSYDVFIYHEV